MGLRDVQTQYDTVLGIYIISSRSLSTSVLLDYFQCFEGVAYVEPEQVMHLARVPGDEHFSSLWAFWNLGQPIQNIPGRSGIDIKAKNAWNITTGSVSSVVAIIDTGVDYTHPDLSPNIWSAPFEFTLTFGDRSLTCPAGTHGIDLYNFTCDPIDVLGHGTHVAGIIGAKGNTEGVVGVNWVAQMLPIKIFNDNTNMSVNPVFAASAIIQLKSIFGSSANIRVMNNSYGGSSFDTTLFNAINELNTNNVLFVASAGNNANDND